MKRLMVVALVFLMLSGSLVFVADEGEAIPELGYISFDEQYKMLDIGQNGTRTGIVQYNGTLEFAEYLPFIYDGRSVFLTAQTIHGTYTNIEPSTIIITYNSTMGEKFNLTVVAGAGMPIGTMETITITAKVYSTNGAYNGDIRATAHLGLANYPSARVNSSVNRHTVNPKQNVRISMNITQNTNKLAQYTINITNDSYNELIRDGWKINIKSPYFYLDGDDDHYEATLILTPPIYTSRPKSYKLDVMVKGTDNENNTILYSYDIRIEPEEQKILTNTGAMMISGLLVLVCIESAWIWKKKRGV